MESRNGYHTIEVRPLSGAVGAEIFGADLASGVDDEQLSEIRGAFHDHGVIFFREQDLTPEQHVSFARRWGRHQRQPLSSGPSTAIRSSPRCRAGGAGERLGLVDLARPGNRSGLVPSPQATDLIR